MGQRYSHLSSDERILIEKLHCERHPGVRKIAEEIGRDKSTVSRELRRGLWFASNENGSYRPCISMLLYIVKRLGVLFWVGCRVYPLDGPLLEFGKVACAAFDLADAARGHAERLADLLLGDVPADA